MKITYRKNLDDLSIDPVQARMALEEAGLLDDVLSLVKNPATPSSVRHAWEFTLKFTRQSPSIILVANALGWTSEQLDALFIRGREMKY